MRRVSHVPLIALGAAAVLAAPVGASAASSVLFSQMAPSASVARITGTTGDLTMVTGHKPVLAFEERPGRRVGTLGEPHFVGLWKTTFATDAPNAVLIGTDSRGRGRRVVVEVTGATRTSTGVRYRVKVIRGVLPPSLRSASLLVDSVPLSAVSAALQAYLDGNGRRVASYVPIINALQFPAWVTVQAAPNVIVRPGNPLVLGGQGGAPTNMVIGQFTMFPTAQVQVPGATMLSLTFANAGAACVVPVGLAFAVTVNGSDGSTVTYPGLTFTSTGKTVYGASAVQTVTLKAYQGGSGMCTLVWDIPPAPPATPATLADGINFRPPVVVTPGVTYTTTTTLTSTSDSQIVLGQVRLQTD